MWSFAGLRELACAPPVDIEEDFLRAAKEIARRSRKTVGQVLSELARSALSRSAESRDAGRGPHRKSKSLGFEPFPRRGRLVTLDAAVPTSAVVGARPEHVVLV